MRPLVIVSDVHLGHRDCDAVAGDLARLVTQHPGPEVVLNGDTFNLSCDPRHRDPAASAAGMIAAHPELQAALGRHLAGGHPLTLVAGNHDAAIQGVAVRRALLDVLTRGDEAALRIEPWFVRCGNIHVEHGHLHDPGNSATHPLTSPSYWTEPVGIALTRRFVGPYDAWELLADQWAATTADNLRLLFEHFGARAPLAVLHYVALLVAVNIEAAVHSRLTEDWRRGDAAVGAYAARVGASETALRALVEGRPRPFHMSFWQTFLRFRFDGVLALLAVPAGAAAALVFQPFSGLAISAAGLAYLGAAGRWLASRGTNHMPEQLRSGADLVRDVTGAEVVVFGHTHIEEEAEGYINLGAFGDRPRPARTYVYVDEHGRVGRRRLSSE